MTPFDATNSPLGDGREHVIEKFIITILKTIFYKKSFSFVFKLLRNTCAVPLLMLMWALLCSVNHFFQIKI